MSEVLLKKQRDPFRVKNFTHPNLSEGSFSL